jgi:hypothetical protein
MIESKPKATFVGKAGGITYFCAIQNRTELWH